MMLQMYVLMFAQHQIEATILTHILCIFVAKVHIDRQHAIMCLTTSIITYSYVSPFVKFACDGIVHARSLSLGRKKNWPEKKSLILLVVIFLQLISLSFWSIP